MPNCVIIHGKKYIQVKQINEVEDIIHFINELNFKNYSFKINKNTAFSKKKKPSPRYFIYDERVAFAQVAGSEEFSVTPE